MEETWLIILLTIDATLRVATPLILAALAGLFAERSGVIDIGLEGKMLAAAFAAAAAAYASGVAIVGLAAAIGVSVALAMVHGFACITHRGNQVVSGVAINVIAAGLTVVLGIAWFRQGGQTPPLQDGARFTSIEWPLAETLGIIPILGPIYREVISGHNILVYLALLAVPATWFVVYRTRFGLRLRAVGETPAAVDTAGISVTGLRYAAMAWCGVLCGVAGAYLSTAHSAAFVRDMTAGKGYIALAAMIFGKWRPWPPSGPVSCSASWMRSCPSARRRRPRHRPDPRTVGPGAALHPDRHPARGLHRQSHRTARQRNSYVKER